MINNNKIPKNIWNNERYQVKFKYFTNQKLIENLMKYILKLLIQ